MMLRNAALLALAITLSACAHPVPQVAPSSTAPRAIAVYRAIAESIYVRTTRTVVAVANSSIDSTCTLPRCESLAARWGVESLWWAQGDSTEARDARADLLARAAPSFNVSAIVHGQPLLLEADPRDVPAPNANLAEWERFRVLHADAAGAVRMSPVGFSRSGHTAVAFVDWRCGPTCGHTLGVALTATSDSTWSIAEMLVVTSKGQ